MGWPHHRIPCHGRIPSNLLLYHFIPGRKPLGFGRQLWKYNLRCQCFLTSEEIPVSSVFKWFIGRELNPSIGSFDIKSFNELRPGLILWVFVNISMVCEQATRRGGFDRVTDSMWLVLAFQAWYVADGLYNEVWPHLISVSVLTPRSCSRQCLPQWISPAMALVSCLLLVI